jgi:hypothetical protein
MVKTVNGIPNYEEDLASAQPGNDEVRVPRDFSKESADIKATQDQQRADALSLLNAKLNGIDTRVADQVAEEKATETRKLGEQRGLNVRGGLIGSNFSSSANEMIRQSTQKNISGYKAKEENDKAIEQATFQQTLSSIDEDMWNKQNAVNTAEDADVKAKSEKAWSQFETIAKSGIGTFEDYKNSGIMPYLQEATGYSEDYLKTIFKANQPQAAKPDISWDKDGNARIVAYDSKTGKLNVEVKTAAELGIPQGSEIEFIENDNGVKMPFESVKDASGKLLYYKPINVQGVNGVPVDKNADQLYSGLSTQTATAVRSKVSKFSTEPMITNFSTVQDGYNFASSISDTTTNPADDQALIYSLAKALDPNSVVREGEYATAQKYSQSWIKSYGKGIEQAISGTGFLSEDARKNIKKTIKQKYETTKKSYDNLYKQYADGINLLTGKGNGKEFLVDYATPSASDTDEKPSQMSLPDGTLLILQSDGTYSVSTSSK